MTADERIMELEERYRDLLLKYCDLVEVSRDVLNFSIEMREELEKYRRLGVDPETVEVVEVEICGHGDCDFLKSGIGLDHCHIGTKIEGSDDMLPESCRLRNHPRLYKVKVGA